MDFVTTGIELEFKQDTSYRVNVSSWRVALHPKDTINLPFNHDVMYLVVNYQSF